MLPLFLFFVSNAGILFHLVRDSFAYKLCTVLFHVSFVVFYYHYISMYFNKLICIIDFVSFVNTLIKLNQSALCTI